MRILLRRLLAGLEAPPPFGSLLRSPPGRGLIALSGLRLGAARAARRGSFFEDSAAGGASACSPARTPLWGDKPSPKGGSSLKNPASRPSGGRRSLRAGRRARLPPPQTTKDSLSVELSSYLESPGALFGGAAAEGPPLPASKKAGDPTLPASKKEAGPVGRPTGPAPLAAERPPALSSSSADPPLEPPAGLFPLRLLLSGAASESSMKNARRSDAGAGSSAEASSGLLRRATPRQSTPRWTRSCRASTNARPHCGQTGPERRREHPPLRFKWRCRLGQQEQTCWHTGQRTPARGRTMAPSKQSHQSRSAPMGVSNRRAKAQRADAQSL